MIKHIQISIKNDDESYVDYVVENVQGRDDWTWTLIHFLNSINACGYNTNPDRVILIGTLKGQEDRSALELAETSPSQYAVKDLGYDD